MRPIYPWGYGVLPIKRPVSSKTTESDEEDVSPDGADGTGDEDSSESNTCNEPPVEEV